MKDWSIRQRVLFSFAVILALMGVMAGVAFERLGQVKAATAELQQDSLPGLHLSRQMMATSLENYANFQNHFISNDAGLLKSAQVTILSGRSKLDTLRDQYEKTVSRSDHRVAFDAYVAALTPYRVAQDRLLALGLSQMTEQTHALIGNELATTFATVREAIGRLVAKNRSASEASARQIGASVRAAETGVALSGLAALVLAVACGFLLLRAISQPLSRLARAVDVMRTGDFSQRLRLTQKDEFADLSDGFDRMSDEIAGLVGQVQESGIQVNTSVTQLAATSKEQQATASEIAATTTEVGATSREISATSKELLRTMTQVAKVAEHSANLAATGQEGLTQMGETMQRVMEATGSINAKLAVLNEKAGNIGRVVTTITRVADQTNLLSLNAAIEAEKAGQYGRGFAVVATEIRRLADQTAVATSDIEQMVKDIQSAVSAGVMGMDRFSEEVRTGMLEVQQVGSHLSEVIVQVQALAPRCEAVNEGMQAQAKGAEQITQALTQLSEAAQQTVDSQRQSNQAIAELNQVTSGLRAGISRFKLQPDLAVIAP